MTRDQCLPNFDVTDKNSLISLDTIACIKARLIFVFILITVQRTMKLTAAPTASNTEKTNARIMEGRAVMTFKMRFKLPARCSVHFTQGRMIKAVSLALCPRANRSKMMKSCFLFLSTLCVIATKKKCLVLSTYYSRHQAVNFDAARRKR